MTTYTYYPKGTCSKQMEVDLEDGVIKDVRVPSEQPGSSLISANIFAFSGIFSST